MSARTATQGRPRTRTATVTPPSRMSLIVRSRVPTPGGLRNAGAITPWSRDTEASSLAAPANRNEVASGEETGAPLDDGAWIGQGRALDCTCDLPVGPDPWTGLARGSERSASRLVSQRDGAEPSGLQESSGRSPPAPQDVVCISRAGCSGLPSIQCIMPNACDGNAAEPRVTNPGRSARQARPGHVRYEGTKVSQTPGSGSGPGTTTATFLQPIQTCMRDEGEKGHHGRHTPCVR